MSLGVGVIIVLLFNFFKKNFRIHLIKKPVLGFFIFYLLFSKIILYLLYKTMI